MRERPVARRAFAHLVAAAALGAAPVHARAQPTCPAPRPTTTWAPPLDRLVSLGVDAPRLPLRVALDRLAAVAQVRLSFSPELLPLSRPSCLDATAQPLGAALARLLGGTGVAAVAVGGDQVVLAPAAAAADAPPVPVLQQVVVTGSTTAAPARRLPFALDVVDGQAFGPAAAAPIAPTLNARVPGLWVWAQPPTSLLARYGSLRGASSFGVSAPKLYLDGVELANPLVVTELPPERIARVEVIRGPQGAALYGADAISGVINIVTRHDGATDGQSRTVTVRSGLGAAGGAFGARPALAQDHAVLLRTGAGPRTAGLSLGVSSLGPYIPGAVARRITATGDLRRVTRTGVVTATARYADAATSAPANPNVGAAFQPPAGASAFPGQLVNLGAPDQRLRQLTAGVTATRTPGDRWTHTLTAGVDAYHLAGLATDLSPLPSALDSGQRAANGSAGRATLRASSSAALDVAPRVRATLTGVADYGLLADATAEGALLVGRLDGSGQGGLGGYGGVGSVGGWRGARSPGDRPGGPIGSIGGLSSGTMWLGTAGLVAQGTLAVDDTWFVTAGLRGERNDGFTAASRFALLPTLGVAAVRPIGGGAGAGGATVKLRAAYGAGHRPARTPARSASWRGAGRAGADVGPETQRGVEAGVDLLAGGRPGTPTLTASVTRFDQRASGLLQQVGGPPPGGWPAASRTPTPGPHRVGYQIENVGEIDNRGWEVEGAVQAGPLALGATASLVDSRVRRTARGYTGDLRAGDRMLQVPRRTLGAFATWQGGRWSAAAQVARASDWINYDRLALAGGTRLPWQLVGDSLRTFWRRYPGVTHLGASVTRDVARGLSVVLTGSNLLNRQQGEPDNATVLPGRTVTAGVRATF